jgi:hypothetical protein
MYAYHAAFFIVNQSAKNILPIFLAKCTNYLKELAKQSGHA